MLAAQKDVSEALHGSAKDKWFCLTAPAWKLHPLKGDMKGHWSVTVNENWRVVFTFEGDNAVLVDYLDHH